MKKLINNLLKLTKNVTNIAMYLYSINNYKICYVNNDNELVLSDLNGNNRNVINSNTDFVSSIIEILLTNNYIVLHTITDDIYYCNITEKKRELVFLANYFVVKIICWKKRIRTDFCFYVLVVSDTKIILFKDFVISDELVISSDDPIINCFSIDCDNKYYACVSLNKTLIFQNEIKIIITLDQPYKSLVISNDTNYYCLQPSGHIDVYNVEWIHIHTINFKRIISISDHNNLILIDSDRNCYQVFFGKLLDQDFVRSDDGANINIPIAKLIYSDNNFNIFLMSEQKYLLTLSNFNWAYIIFDDYIIFSSKSENSTHRYNFNFNTTGFFKMYDSSVFISIDENGTVQRNCIETRKDVHITSITCNYVIKKLTKMSKTKSARFVTPLLMNVT